MRYRPEGFISVDEALFYFIRVMGARPWTEKVEAASSDARKWANKGLTPESQRALAIIDGWLGSPEDLWSQAPNSPRARAAGELKEALLAEKLYGYVFRDRYIKRIPAALWSAPKDEDVFESGQISLLVSKRELILKWWLRFEEIRGYFSGKAAAPSYPLLDGDVAFNFAEPVAPPADPQRRPNNGGRTATFDWAAIAAETVKFLHENGRPESQAQLVEHIQSWYSERYAGKEPGTTTVKRFVSQLWRELGSYEERP